MKNLIRCGACELEGKINILGEIDPFCDLLVLRFHSGITRISGNSYLVMCEVHKEPIYIRRGVDNTGTISYQNLQVRKTIFSFQGSYTGGTG